MKPIKNLTKKSTKKNLTFTFKIRTNPIVKNNRSLRTLVAKKKNFCL